MSYRGRLAPTPTGYLHLGHARTFWMAQERARQHNGTLLYRNEDLDPARCKPKFRATTLEDLRWLGLEWEGEPVNQSERMPEYRAAFEKLRANGHLFPCACSRKDIREATTAPHSEDGEPIYPGTCRSNPSTLIPHPSTNQNWRFRVPEGERIEFTDAHFGPQSFVSGKDFGDFPVWQKNDLPAYQLAVVVDDAAMEITEVVRGADLLLSTARQLLLYRALGLTPPTFYHCELMCDEKGERLAKRNDALSLKELRASGNTPEALRAHWE
ncbi:MAG: tRNA glutamyl-Q(34) synthetase GluQRS [Verrucomicrobia subdivision 3 bacterium]|nr:tRNA glutamyl-Q(34) synthetase GluQRS [Limisphaerales bacterium]